MRNQNRLTFLQQTFLRSLRDKRVTLPEAVAAAAVKPALLARWLRRRYFRESAGEMTGEIRRQFELELELLARMALATLAEQRALGEKASEAVVLVCRAILDAYHQMRQRKNWRRKQKRRRQPPKDLCHPKMKHREEELLRVLAGDAAG